MINLEEKIERAQQNSALGDIGRAHAEDTVADAKKYVK